MNNENDKINSILNSINGIKKAEMPPFFYTRLMAKMENELIKASQPFFMLRPAFLTTCLFIVFAFNMIALRQNFALKKQSNKQAATIENFANAYNLNTESVYE